MLGKIKDLWGAGKIQQQKGSDDAEQKEYIKYAVELESVLRLLEAQLHNTDDSEEIIQNGLRTACNFYEADWAGFLEIDLELGLWTHTASYKPGNADRVSELLDDFESSEFMHRWIDAMHDNSPIVINGIEKFRELNPNEFELYKHLNISTLLAVPVKPRPTGFLLVRNPKRYLNRSSMLQLLAYVILSAVNERKMLQSLKMQLSPASIAHDTDIIINVFGDLEIYTSKGVLKESDLKSPKICRLIVYMLLNRQLTLPAGRIAEALWPEESPDADYSGRNLRTLIFRFRQAFGLVSEYQLIETATNGYRFNPKFSIKTDMDLFDECWNAVQKTTAISSKVDILKQAVDLYKGNILSSAAGEDWLLPVSTHYNLRYIGVVRELFRVLSEQKDYHNIQKYAVKALAVDDGNVDAYYWLIYSMIKMDAFEMSHTQLDLAKNHLTEEEFIELSERLRKVSVEPLHDHFRNENLDR